MYKPYHAIGLELGISVASVGLRREPTGAPVAWHADVVATAKRDLAAGETLDGEGGYTVYGKLMPAADSLRLGGLPLGLAHGMKIARPVAAHTSVRWSDVATRSPAPHSTFGVKWSERCARSNRPRPACRIVADQARRTLSGGRRLDQAANARRTTIQGEHETETDSWHFRGRRGSSPHARPSHRRAVGRCRSRADGRQRRQGHGDVHAAWRQDRGRREGQRPGARPARLSHSRERATAARRTG
jgi:hypothetical protein